MYHLVTYMCIYMHASSRGPQRLGPHPLALQPPTHPVLLVDVCALVQQQPDQLAPLGRLEQLPLEPEGGGGRLSGGPLSGSGPLRSGPLGGGLLGGGLLVQ